MHHTAVEAGFRLKVAQLNSFLSRSPMKTYKLFFFHTQEEAKKFLFENRLH